MCCEEEYLRMAGFTREEKNSFDKFLKSSGMIDTYRHFHPTKIEFTQCDGWRLDYILASNSMIKTDD